MSRPTLASHPLLLGFERLDELVERAQRSGGDGYPPYNVEQHGADRYRITIAAAGFGADDLSVSVEEGQLVVRGKRAAEAEGREFLHRGIATRQFQRSFALAEHMEVTGAHYENGLLSVDLERRRIESDVQRVAIKTEG